MDHGYTLTCADKRQAGSNVRESPRVDAAGGTHRHNLQEEGRAFHQQREQEKHDWTG